MLYTNAKDGTGHKLVRAATELHTQNNWPGPGPGKSTGTRIKTLKPGPGLSWDPGRLAATNVYYSQGFVKGKLRRLSAEV